MAAKKESIFDCAYNEGLVHQAVVAYLAGGRAGTKAQKNRSAVSGGGAKPWRQKGTGRARAGTIRSPIWRGGGKTFAATTRSFKQKMNRKEYRRAMAMIVAELMRSDRLSVVDAFEVKTHKTKDFAKQIASYESNHLLIVVSELEDNLVRASGNLHTVHVAQESSLNPAVLVAADKVVITKDALAKLEERLS